MDKERFIWLLKNSVKITTDEYVNTIYYYMDKNVERQLKLHKILDINKPININLNNIDNNYLLFEQNIKTKKLWVDYSNIWGKLKSNNAYKGLDISELICGLLKDDTNWKVYTPYLKKVFYTNLLKDDTNWKVYTPTVEATPSSFWLKDDTNWKVYTPTPVPSPSVSVLKDDTNWKVYTPGTSKIGTVNWLKDDTNWKVYTPNGWKKWVGEKLKDDTNWKTK